jgi:hypothetical protein
VDHYLDKFDCCPHSVFLPSTLRAQVRDGTINTASLYSICAIVCKFSVNPDIRSQESELAAESKKLLQADISIISLEKIQARLLVALRSLGEGARASEALFFRERDLQKPRVCILTVVAGIASAMAEIIDLITPLASTSVIQNEVRRRVWWSIYMVDVWCISGQELRCSIRDLVLQVRAPMNDLTFLSMRSSERILANEDGRGLFA